MAKKIGVLMGGLSSEREVSLNSGKNVAEALAKKGYDVFTVDLTEDIEAFVATLKREKPDAVFNALHGKYGEDGCVQGLLELMKIPYTHSGPSASALAMNKVKARHVYESAGLPVAKGRAVSKAEILANDVLPRPFVLKPACDGSSVGVYIFGEKTADKPPFDEKTYPYPDDATVLAEEYIAGREMTVAVLNGKALGVLEIVPSVDWYDYSAKYTDGGAKHIVPADMPADDYAAMMAMAEKAHEALGCRGVSRTDFRYDDTKKGEKPRIVILETNTQPGMTSLSLVPDIARYAGYSYEDLVAALVEEARCENSD